MQRYGTRRALAASLLVYAALNTLLAGGLGVAGRGIGLSDAGSGLILSLGALVGMVAAPLWGMAVDTWGRRRTLLLAVPMLTLGAMVLALAFEGPTTLALPTLLVGRLLQAGCGAGIIPASQALVADLTPRGRRANGMATMSATLALGSILGSALLLATGESGLQTGFAILAGMSVLASVLAAGVPSDRQEPVPRPDASANSALRMLWPNLLATLAGYLAYTMILPLHGLRLLDKGGVTAGQANAQAGMILLAGAVALFLAQAAISVAARPNPRRLFRLGSVGALVGFVALVLAGDAISMAVAVALIGGCLGLAVSSNLALISLAVGPDLQGRAAGANAAMRALGIALGPLVGLGLYQPGGILPFVAAFVMIVVVVLASLRA